MSPDGSSGPHGDTPRDQSWPFDPFREDEDPLRPRPPLHDPFAQPDPFASTEDPFGLDDPFRAARPFDPRRDYLDPFQPDEETGRPRPPQPPQPGGGPARPAAPPPASAGPAPPPPNADPFAPAERPYPSDGPARPSPGSAPFDSRGQRFPEVTAFPPAPVPPRLPVPPAPPAGPAPPGPAEASGPPADALGDAGGRGQAPIPSRAARHQAKRRTLWRPSRGSSGAPPATPSGAPPADPFGEAGPALDGPPAGPPADGVPIGGPPAGFPAGGAPPAGPAFDPFEPAELDSWQPHGQPVQALWTPPTAAPEDGTHHASPEHIEPFGHLGTKERMEPATPNGSATPQAPARPARSPAPPRRRRLALPTLGIPAGLARSSLVLAAVLVAASLGLGAVSGALPMARRPPTPATAPPYSARWVCPTLPGQASAVNVANVGSGTAALRTTVIRGSDRRQPSQRSLGAGNSGTVKLPAAKQPGYVQVEAFSAPVVVSAGGQAGCTAGPTDRLWIPTSDTSLGASTTVVIANPDGDPAVVDLIPHVSQGSQQAVAEVFVPPRSAVTKPFSYGQLVGLKPAIEVIAKSGRVVAGAVIAQKDKQRIYVPAQTATKTAWAFAGGLAGTDRSTSVLITNPSSSPLSVSVQVSTDRGTFKPGNDFDNPVPAGAAVAVQVPPLRIGGSGAFAVRIRSRDNAQFIAALRVTTPGGQGTASYVDLGSGEPDNRWLVPAVPASKRVVLANLGDVTLTVRLTGGGSGAGAGGTVDVGPGRVVVRDLPRGARSVQVTSDLEGLLVASLGSGLVLPGTAIGGVPPGGPVIAGPAAA
jgi:hypothetical protein